MNVISAIKNISNVLEILGTFNLTFKVKVEILFKTSYRINAMLCIREAEDKHMLTTNTGYIYDI